MPQFAFAFDKFCKSNSHWTNANFDQLRHITNFYYKPALKTASLWRWNAFIMQYNDQHNIKEVCNALCTTRMNVHSSL